MLARLSAAMVADVCDSCDAVTALAVLDDAAFGATNTRGR